MSNQDTKQQIDYRQTLTWEEIISDYRYRIALPEELTSITETDLWEFQQKISHCRYRFSLEFQLISITDAEFRLKTKQFCNHFGYNRIWAENVCLWKCCKTRRISQLATAPGEKIQILPLALGTSQLCMDKLAARCFCMFWGAIWKAQKPNMALKKLILCTSCRVNPQNKLNLLGPKSDFFLPLSLSQRSFVHWRAPFHKNVLTKCASSDLKTIWRCSLKMAIFETEMCELNSNVGWETPHYSAWSQAHTSRSVLKFNDLTLKRQKTSHSLTRM